MSDLENDLEKWTRDKLFAVMRDAMMRCEVVGIDGHTFITALAVELAARSVACTTMPSEDAGLMFVGAINELRKAHAARQGR